MSDPALDPYPPLNVLKPLDDDLWIVDGPVVRMRYLVGSIPFSTRMTVVRLADGRLWLHSPTELTEELRQELARLGRVAWLIAPNRLHWVNLAAWQQAYPHAETHAAPGVEVKADEGGFRIDTTLQDRPPAAWADTLDQRLVPGSFMTEAVFLHRPSATLIVTDLIENFERDHLHGRLLTWMMRIGGVLAPNGSTPRDLRQTFRPHRAAAGKAAEAMIGWAPKRIVLAHGRCIERDATPHLRRALAWTGAKG